MNLGINQAQKKLNNQKVMFVKSTATDDAQTCDEKSKIVSSLLDTKKQDFCILKQDQSAKQLKNQNEVNMVSKSASYFLQIQQQSVILQEPFQQSPNQQTPKHSRHEQRLKKKISNQSQAKRIQKQTSLVYSSIIYVINTNCCVIEKNAYIWDKFLSIGQSKININEITKIKCLLDMVAPNERKLKIIQNKNQVYYFAASTSMKPCSSNSFCQHFLWFSKIITNKMQSINHLLKNRCSTNDKNQPKNIPYDNFIKGYILKKSQHFQNWQQRFVVITQSQLLSFKKQSENPSFVIKAQSIKYIWTRFDLQNGYLIIKIKHGISKTQFGIPVMNFAVSQKNNWLYAFYRIMISHKKQENQQF